ncbi:threonine--tRNA ligase [Microlunatus sp. Gsoil 973]|uniref:threonine--tRNA ligase n=1 Tax=Microlunatus sp. Gsoil 973 TaxID=2672569 RepID=UPI0012B47795|nr:threonine--tRNA ligase [Microlunatus sp. Gsoil 973]QGN32679.1 threonine--tRNA ligase [Microlunatus sp. Gsoil 973]
MNGNVINKPGETRARKSIDNQPRRPGRDHRELGRDMHLFAGNPIVGAGLPLWLPAGAVIRRELEQYAHEMAVRTGCQGVYSPVLAKRELFERSGHWAKFSDDMFPVMELGSNAGDDQLVLRPANCPHHAMIYAAGQHSYRELPIRYNELAPMFRAERSGVLSGLSRVRQISLDDTHVFCRPDQLATEVALAMDGVLESYDVLGIGIHRLRLSRRGPGDGYLGPIDQWRHAEDQLRDVLDAIRSSRPDLEVLEAPGEAAFYGPKIDVQVVDARGQEETLSTVQLDFNQPERFELDYVADDGSRQRVIMIHRGLLSSMERMVAFLLEITDGWLPLWLAPVQLSLLPVAAAHHDHAYGLADRLRRSGIRVQVAADGTLGSRIRDARRERTTVIGVIGDAEMASDSLAVQELPTGPRQQLATGELVSRLSAAVAERARGPYLAD